ncbi:MAG: preprotein translocase subunit SecG [Tenericutes bacterium]|nr:preprotein translocase subunit SecG [Mycoplasmatota bacterium]
MTALHWILFALSLILIALVMIQESKDDVKNTFSGEKSDLFKNQKQRGSELLMTRITVGFASAFVIIAILALAL